ncbi:MAG TPA: SMC-Scp complex subunit ScpB, partial [Chitinophagaceae bacterium]|nr:SMC-Scp complex subunit ScpB [Chitinophagaceae bacterium]
NAFGFMEDKITLDQVETSIDGIREKYASEFYPFELRQSGGGWQFLTKRDFHKTIAQLNGDKFLKRLSTAALETLAIIAYKQPITKGDIEAIRGVNSDYSIQKLLEKELIVITGRNEQMPGKPLVYSTSRHFMDYFGINSAEELPRINEVLAEQIVAPTLVNADHFDVEEGAVLAVSEDGELIAKEEGVAEITIEYVEEFTEEDDPTEAEDETIEAEDDRTEAEDETIEIVDVEEVEDLDDPTELNEEDADATEDESSDNNDNSNDGSADASDDDSEESTPDDEDNVSPRP